MDRADHTESRQLEGTDRHRGYDDTRVKRLSNQNLNDTTK